MKPQCNAMKKDGKTQCKRAVSEFGSLQCVFHSDKGRTVVPKNGTEKRKMKKVEKQRQQKEKCYAAEMIPWMKLLSAGVASLLHHSQHATNVAALEEGMSWLSKLGTAFIAQGGALTEQEVKQWLYQEQRNCNMTIALVKSLGKEPLLWLLTLMENFGTEEQKHSLHLAR